VLFAFLRPDPLRLATALAAEEEPEPEAPPSRVPLRRLVASAPALAGLAAVVTANIVMVAVMAMAPVHMERQGHGLELVGLVISLHVAGMFAPAPLTLRLTDRAGPLPVAGAGAALLALAGIGSAVAHGALPFALALALLGVGWNAALVAGSTLLASAVPVAERPRAEGLGELSMGVAAATATGLAGPVVGLAGYAALALAGTAAAVCLGPLLCLAARRGAPARTVRANRLLT
jgi:MFS family permease